MSTPAGWYQDPSDGNFQRYWDGSGWTEHQQPMPQPGSMPGAAQQGSIYAPTGGAYGQPVGYGQSAYYAVPQERPAAWGWRLLTYLLDYGVLIGVPLTSLQVVLNFSDLVFSTVFAVVCFVYRLAMVTTRGATLFQGWFKMRVVEKGGSGPHPSMNASLIRALLAVLIFNAPSIISQLLNPPGTTGGFGYSFTGIWSIVGAIPLVGSLWPLFNREHQGWHDLVAKTVVVKLSY